MTVQTAKNDPINRGEEDRLKLKNMIISTWLERRFLVKTFEEEIDEEYLDESIGVIRTLLDED